MDATTTAGIVHNFVSQFSDTLVLALPYILGVVAGVIALSMGIRWVKRHAK